MENNPYSYHLFLFPFQWDYIPGGKLKREVDFETRTSLSICEQQFDQTAWKRNPFTIGEETNPHTDYNEFTFFYDFVRKSIFDYEDRHDENERLRYFQYNRQNVGTYSISIRNSNANNEKYTLNIISISLHLYNTGVGILTYNLKNMSYPDPESILKINEFGRRIYPQFLGIKFTEQTKNAFLPDKIVVDLMDGKKPAEESFNYFNNANNLQESCFKLPQHILHLFAGTLFTDQDHEEERILTTNIMDDRMFTLCWYGNNQIAKELSVKIPQIKNYAFANSEWWYKYIFCDKDWPSCQNEFALIESITEHTYARWANYGTYFGITRETFMLLSNDIAKLSEFKAPPIYDHLRTIYFQIAVLCLISRSSLLRFSGEVSRLGDLANHHKLGEKEFFIPIEKLYENYIEFINKIHFREVTAQIQGIELYKMLYKHMDLKEQVSDLDKELDELHRFVSMRREKARNEDAQTLNWIAALFLPITVVSGLLGINYSGGWTFDGKFNGTVFMPIWIVVGISLLLAVLVWVFIKLLKKLF